MSFKLASRIEIRDKYSNLDYLYGPYEADNELSAIQIACNSIEQSRRARGLTVGIISESGNLEEYWWKNGTSNEDLEKKVEEYELSIDSVRHVSSTDTNEIIFYIRVSGKGFGVQTNIYLGSNKITNISTLLNQEQAIIVKAPENPGNYSYTISAVDTILGNGVQQNYDIIWKEVDVKVSPSSPIFTYKVKSLQNVINSSFSFQIYKIDSLQISSVSIVYGNNEHILFQSGNGEYQQNYTVNINSLSELQSGDLIQVKIEGSNLSQTFFKDIVQLTAPGVFAQCAGTIPSTAYNGLSFSATFSFEAESEGNYQVVIKDGNTIVYNSSLLSYSTNILTIKLNDSSLSQDNTSSYHTLQVFIDNQDVPSYTYNTLTLLYVEQQEQLTDLDSNTLFKNNLNFELQDQQTLTLNSYILDLVCYIPYTETSSVLFNFADITINKDIIQFRNIVYPTPIQQDISIGFACNIKTSYQNVDYYYDALFINGVLCAKYPYQQSANNAGVVLTNETEITDEISNKIRLYYNTLGGTSCITESPERFLIERNYKARNPELADSSNLPIFNIIPLNNILSKANLTDGQIEQIHENKVSIDGVTYDVIDSTSYKIGNFGNLGESKYDIDDIISDFCTAYNEPSAQQHGETVDEKNDRIISSLKKKVKKNPKNIPNDYLTLTRQIVQSKGLLQKYVAVPCQWEYQGNQGYLLAFTQGTSTLEYALPNFTFKFYTDSTFQTTQNVHIIPKIERTLSNILTYSNEINNSTEYYEEKELVAKADYMESSHLNNTPTAMFYNAITTQQNGYDVVNDSGRTVNILPNPVVDKLNAIEGIPIILVINSINYGSFMLNVGKAGKSIGFGNNAISLEGTSNDDNSGMSSRFGFSEKDIAAKQFIDNIATIEDIDNMESPNEDFIKFLSEGLEYRYSGKDLGDLGEEEDDPNNPYSEYFRILKMWYWVYTNNTYTKAEFEEMFNFDFAALYYIQMMIFGQTDNLGKNCMFDQFTEDGQWYVRPYDMDSQAGLNNNGVDNLTPVIEISKQFVLAEEDSDDQIFYLNQYTPRFPYSSKTSNLWIRFYRNLKPEIEAFYGYLRKLGYSAEAVIALCQKELIDKLKITQYNIDFQNKYLTNSIPDQQFAYGNRWVKFKDWIQKRFDFCDTYFAYNKYQANTTGTGITYAIKYSLPQYTIYKYNNLGGEQTVSHWGKNCNLTFNSVTKQTMYFSPKYIVDDDNIFQTGFSSLVPKVKLNNLVSYQGTWYNLCNVVDLSENTYLQNMSVDSIGTSGDGVIPTSIKTLTITNSSQIPQLVGFSNLSSVTFSNCEGNIYLKDCPSLQTINISSGKQINLTLINCGNEISYINLNNSSSTFGQVIINGCYINYLNLQGLKLNLSFTGSESYIKVVNLSNATLLNGELNIDNLNTNVLLLNSISESKIITTKIKSYQFLGLYNSAITQWGNTPDTFNGQYFSNIDQTKMVADEVTKSIITQLLNNTYSGSSAFRLRGCVRIKNVINLNVNSSAIGLFSGCNMLEKVTNSNVTASGSYMFYRCYKLDTLPTEIVNGVVKSTINFSQTTENNTQVYSASCMFQECHKLSYTDIEKVLLNNLQTKYWNNLQNKYQDTEISGVEGIEACKAINYDNFLYYKTHNQSTTIDLSLYAFATSMSSCFCVRSYGNENTSYANSQKVTLTYTGKLPKQILSAHRLFSSNENHKIILPDDIMEDCTKLTNLSFCFAYNTYNENDNNYYLKIPRLPNNEGLVLDRACMGSRVDLTNLKENGLVYLPSNTTTCYTMFQSASLLEETEVSQIFSKCTNLVNVSNCFRGCSNFTCNYPVSFYNNGNNAVNICGIFASVSCRVKFGFEGNWYSQMYVDGVANHKTTYVIGTHSNSSMPESSQIGPYYNTEVEVVTGNMSFGSIYPMQGVLHGAKIYSTDPLTLEISINCYDCRAICKGITAVNSNVTIEISQLNGIKYAKEAFSGTSILTDASGTIAIPNTLINAPSMFANTKIKYLPTGLKDCSQLNDISRMFSGCEDLGGESQDPTLPRSEFFLPISVKNINYLFDGCHKLHGGIPTTFIEFISEYNSETQQYEVTQRTQIKELIQTFARSAVLESAGNDISPLNISELFPEVTNITGLFYSCGSSTYNGTRQSLNPVCFSKCVTCDDLFNSAEVTLPSSGCNFSVARSMRFAFATYMNDTRNIITGGTNNIIIGLDTDISGLFASSKGENNEVKNNLNTLLNLKANTRNSIYGMLYGYNDDLSKEEYKYIAATSARPIRSSRGF